MLRHSRRFQFAALAATVAGLAALGTLGACSSGQITETAYMRAAVPGVSQNFTVTGAAEAPATNVALRNMLVVYGGVNGYPAGASAPLQLSLFNNTPAPVKVTISAPAVASGLSIRQNPAGSVGASPQSVEPSGSPSASASNSSSAVPTGSPAATKSAAPSGTSSGTPAGSTSAKPSASASETPSSEPASSAPATGGSSVSFTIAPTG
ncbi:MAG: hypothetical protein HOV83_33505, partial [Catenulispora sp.]|nr:hypothetical protein [Catenulispora sp.]